jgi:glutamyl-tRNA synthetase
VLPQAQADQLSDLLALGLHPDVVLVQSEFHARHWLLFTEAVQSGQVYPCDCSRKDVQAALAAIASAPHSTPAVYSGHCRELDRNRALHASESLAWRFRMRASNGKDDVIIARSGVDLDPNGLPPETSFVPSYHWACAIDDFDGAYDLLVRSIDLWSAAETQRAIQEWLSWREGLLQPRLPVVFHTSLVTQNDGHRLEKRTRGVTLPELAHIGLNTADLIHLFKQSFDLKSFESALITQPKTSDANQHQSGGLLREKLETISLAQLGLNFTYPR